MYNFEKHKIMILNNTLGECEKKYTNIQSASMYKKKGAFQRMLFKIHKHIFRGEVKVIGMVPGNVM